MPCAFTACGTNPTGTTTTSTTSALVGDQNNQGNDDHQGDDDHGDHGDIKHVLLITVDGMHQSDLDWYVANHPSSTLAKLTHSGSEYTNAATSNPSDSDPGGTALMTGGNPKSTGVFYDVEYSHKVDEAGAACTPGQPATGGDVIYDSPDDALANVPDFIDPANGTFPSFDENGSIFANGVDTNPAAIMNLKFDPETSLNSGTFPVDPKTCKPITPWDYLGDNTIFQVIHHAGLRTAWSDKHEVYTSFNGPGSNGQSIDDLFSPEIDSQAVMPNGVPYPQDDDWAHIDAATKQYDGYKVQAILNEIDGLDHSGKTHVGTPAIFGMNFQTVSVAREDPLDSDDVDRSGRERELHHQRSGGRWLPVGQRSARSRPRPLERARLRRRSTWPHGFCDPQGRPRGLDDDHRHGQARPVAAGSEQAHHRPGRPDHQRDQRRLGADAPEQHEPDRRRNRRRPVAVLPVGQLAGRLRLRQELPVEPHRCRVSTSTRTPSPSSTRASPRSGPALPPPTSSASRSTTATTRTSSARSRRASSTRSRPSSPSTVA